VLLGETIEEEHTRQVKGIPTTFLDIRSPMRDDQGHIVGICGISRNITERSKTVAKSYVALEEYPSAAMRATLDKALLAAGIDRIVLITGESGTGKDYLARYIHANSKRSSGPFYSVNCAAIPPDLAESELFGHEAGAFSGATRRKRGLVELAEGGTLLLNEIGELSTGLQAKLLTFLDTYSFTRVGGEKTITVSARIMAATNRNLDKEVANGRFRQDLFYRLNVFSIEVPPLRERSEDIPFLVRQILNQLTEEMRLPEKPEIDLVDMDSLLQYSWQGNVRELRNVLERATILSKGRYLRFDVPASHELEAPCGLWTIHFPPRPSLTEAITDMRRKLVQEALRYSGGNKMRASRLLGISRYALRRQMRALGMDGR
jgi:DNA-binding NtrC family response regulator